MIHPYMMTDATALRRSDCPTWLRSRIRACILLALVTSEDIAANLIDQAIALARQLEGTRPVPA